MSRNQFAQRVSRGERITADATNRLVDKVNAIARPNLAQVPAAIPAQRTRFLQIADIDPANTYIQCVHLGAVSDPFQVNLPNIYIETQRDFGGTIGLVTYVYTDRNTRTATGTSTETQFLTPPLVIGEVIQVAPVEEFFLMLPDGRMWAVDPP